MTRARSVVHRCLFQAMGMRKRTKIEYVRTSSQGIALRRPGALRYVAPAVATVVTCATGVRHIYLILKEALCYTFLSLLVFREGHELWLFCWSSC